MENIGFFVDFITAYGVQQEYIFVTVDLYERTNLWQVKTREAEWGGGGARTERKKSKVEGGGREEDF